MFFSVCYWSVPKIKFVFVRHLKIAKLVAKGVAIWSPFSIPLCAISTKIFTCVSQTSGTIRHAFLRTSGQEGSFFFFAKSFCVISTLFN